MNTLTHPVAPEEIMALLDGELPSAEAKKVEAHIEECSECASVRDELRGTADALRVWMVPAVSAEMERAVAERVERAAAKGKVTRSRTYTPLSFGNWRLWAIGGGGAVAAAGLTFFLVFIPYFGEHTRQNQRMDL